MRIIVFGAGAVGGITAAYLKRAGIDTLVITRPAYLGQLNTGGLHIINPDSEFNVRIEAFDGPQGLKFEKDDMVFLAVKSQDTKSAVQELKKYAPDLPVFCLQNGVSNELVVSEYFTRVYGVVVIMIAYSLKPGEIADRAHIPGIFIIGKYPQGEDELSDKASSLLALSGFTSMTSPDIMPYKWGKLLTNLSNSVNAALKGSVEEQNFISGYAVREAEAILKSAGIKSVSSSEMNKSWPEIVTLPQIVLDNRPRSSTWQSIERGVPNEADYLNGEIVRLAEKTGLSAPINRKLCDIVNEMSIKKEKPGKYSFGELVNL